jgi:hypothetical protein
MDDVFSQLSSGGMTVTITKTHGMRVTADTDLKAGATWKTSEINHLSVHSAVGRFLNTALDLGDTDQDGDYVEIGCSHLDLRILVGPDGVELIYLDDSGKKAGGKLTEMGVDLLIEHLTAYKAQRDARLSSETPGQ